MVKYSRICYDEFSFSKAADTPWDEVNVCMPNFHEDETASTAPLGRFGTHINLMWPQKAKEN